MNEVVLEEMGVDLRMEIRIAQFWRELITDEAYLRFDPIDMVRWYQALELRGPEEIRDYLTERPPGPGVKTMTGLVAKAPHPPIWLVEAWLSSYEEQVSVPGVKRILFGMIVMGFMLGSWISGWPYLWTVGPQYPGAGPQTTAMMPLAQYTLSNRPAAPAVAAIPVVSESGHYRSTGGAGSGGVAASGIGSNGTGASTASAAPGTIGH